MVGDLLHLRKDTVDVFLVVEDFNFVENEAVTRVVYFQDDSDEVSRFPWDGCRFLSKIEVTQPFFKFTN